MSRTKELPLIPVSDGLLEHQLQQRLGCDSRLVEEPQTYTVTFSFSFGTLMGLGDTAVGIAVLRIVSVVIAAGGFVASLAVILLAPYFPSLVSAAPAPALNPLGPSAAASSPYRRNTMPPLRRRPSPIAITVSVRRDPTIVSIIERRDSASPSPAPPNRRVSFSPQSSSTSVPTVADFASAPSSSTGHTGPCVLPSPGPSVRSACSRIRDRERDPAYILPTPPASITSVSSEADDTEMLDEFGMGGASPAVGKRGRRSFPFVGRRKDKGKEVARDKCEAGLFGSRKRSQSLGYVVEGSVGGSAVAQTPPSHPRVVEERTSSELEEPLRDSESETSGRATERDERASRSTVDKEARRRSGISFQDFKAAFGKRERRGSAGPGAYTLSPGTVTADIDHAGLGNIPRSAQALGLGEPSGVQVSPRSASDESTAARRRSAPVRLDAVSSLGVGIGTGVQSPSQQRSQAPLFGGEVVIRNESGRRRTRSSAIPGLYADAEVVRRL